MNIMTRAQWGARCADGFGPLKPPALEVWLHHTGGSEPDTPAGIRQLEQVGQDRFGGGISYTFLVGQSGTVYEGTTPNRQGAHTLGHNLTGRAICWLGNFEVIKPTDAIIQSTAELLVLGKRSGWWTQAKLTGGHRDVFSTACPGRNAYAVIGEVNKRTQAGDDVSLTSDQDRMLREIHHESTVRLPSRAFPGAPGGDTVLGYACNADGYGFRAEKKLAEMQAQLDRIAAAVDKLTAAVKQP